MEKVSVVMRQHNTWCVYVRSVWRGMPNRVHVHTPNVMLPHHHTNILHF